MLRIRYYQKKEKGKGKDNRQSFANCSLAEHSRKIAWLYQLPHSCCADDEVILPSLTVVIKNAALISSFL